MLDKAVEGWGLLVLEMLRFCMDIYNSLLGMAVGMLGQDPATWNRSGWNFIKEVNTVFLGIGGTLVVIFFLMGFCADSVDIKQDFRIENILRMFLKLSLAEFFVMNSLKIVRQLFALSTGIIGKISAADLSFQYAIPEKVSSILSKPLENGFEGAFGIGGMIVLLITAIIFLLVMGGCGLMILFEAFQRFLKILMIVPYGTLANSTIAGNHMLTRTAESFWKYMLCTILEAVTMYMAVALSAAVISSGILNLVAGKAGFTYILSWMIEGMFTAFLMLGMVKGSETLTQRALGL